MQGEDEAITATRWLNEIFLPITRAIPADLRGKLEPAELFHELLEHRWYLSERNGHDVPIGQAMADYILTILPTKPVEETVVGVDTVEMPVVAHLDD